MLKVRVLFLGYFLTDKMRIMFATAATFIFSAVYPNLMKVIYSGGGRGISETTMSVHLYFLYFQMHKELIF